MLNILEKIADIIYKTTSMIAGLLLALITALVSVQVISRFFFSFSIDFAQELVILALVWLVFLGTSMGVFEGTLVTLTLITDKLSEKRVFQLDVIGKLIMISFFIITAIYNTPVLKFAKATKMPTLKISYFYLAVSYSISAVIMAYYLLIELISSISTRRKNKEV